MENKIVGYIILGFSILLGIVIYMFNNALNKIVNVSCSHGPSCPMWGTIEVQTNISMGVMGFIILIGLYLILFADNDLNKPLNKKSPHKRKKGIYNNLNENEKLVLDKLFKSNGIIFQSNLVKKTGFTKVRITRILDKLENKGIIERRRHGMTNKVILKH
jgi:uncharacterized membrane protein